MPEAADADDTAMRPEARFGMALRRARQGRGLSLRALAKRLNRAHSNLHDYEVGNRLPPADVVQGYEDVLDLAPRSLTSLHRQVANELEEQDARYSSAIGAGQSSAGDTGPGDGAATEADGRRKRARAPLVAAVVLAATAAAALIVSVTPRGGEERPLALATVYNLEVECQIPRTDNCRLGLVRDPYARYTRENVIGYVWHGDRLVVDCFVPDGAQVQAEDRTMSTRWYRVTVPEDALAAPVGEKAWLTAIRIRSGTQPDVKRCSG